MKTLTYKFWQTSFRTNAKPSFRKLSSPEIETTKIVIVLIMLSSKTSVSQPSITPTSIAIQTDVIQTLSMTKTFSISYTYTSTT